MTLKKINYNFYQISSIKKNALTSKSLSEALSNLANAEFSIPMKISNKSYFVHEISQQNNLIQGTFIVANMDNLNASVDPTTKIITRLPLPATEGLENHSTFLIDPKANILVMEKSSLSPSMLFRYFSQTISFPKVQAAILINPSELQKFYKMDRIGKFSVKVARIENGNIFSSQNSGDLSISQVIKAADNTNSDELTFSLSVKTNDEARKSLSKNKIFNFVRDFLNYKETKEVVELKVGGDYIDEEGRTNPILLDLIKERLHDYTEVENDERNSLIFKTSEKFRKLEIMYNLHKDSLHSTYSIE